MLSHALTKRVTKKECFILDLKNSYEKCNVTTTRIYIHISPQNTNEDKSKGNTCIAK